MSSPPRKRRSQRALKEENHIEVANKTSDAEFTSRYMRPADGWTGWSHPETGTKYTLDLLGTPQLDESDLEACFNLVEETSGEDYRQSSVGWHAAAKRKEMHSPELRYLLVRTVDGGEMHGFMSMMPTFENGEPVVYLYEIHLRPELQGSVCTVSFASSFTSYCPSLIFADMQGGAYDRSGLGRQLIGYAQSTASSIPGVGKAMLTCFKSNKGGLRFYDKLGFVLDESSPRDRRLRGGKVVTSDYVILSWRGTDRAQNGDDVEPR